MWSGYDSIRDDLDSMFRRVVEAKLRRGGYVLMRDLNLAVRRFTSRCSSTFCRVDSSSPLRRTKPVLVRGGLNARLHVLRLHPQAYPHPLLPSFTLPKILLCLSYLACRLLLAASVGRKIGKLESFDLLDEGRLWRKLPTHYV